MSDNRDLVSTIFFRLLGLLSSFGLVILSTQLLGATGRGYISLLIADSALIAILTNILSGSSAMFHMHKFDEGKVFNTAMIWILFSSLICTSIIYLIQPINFFLLFWLSFSLSFHSLISNQLFVNQKYFIGNLLGLIVQLLFFIVLLLFWILGVEISWQNYFYIQIVIWIFLSSFFIGKIKIDFLNVSELKEIATYGFRNELSYIFQFLSYRVSYFIIYYELGVNDLGVFGVCIILAESTWVISKSVSTVSYSKQIVDVLESESIKRTNRFASISFYLTLLVIVVIWFIPDQLITSIFSKEFGNLKVLFLVLSPGILAIAVTNIFGHYFAAKNRQGILILKSFIGFLCSLILTPVFIKLYHFWGAALAMSVSYLVSSVILVFAYIKEIRMNKNSLLY